MKPLSLTHVVAIALVVFGVSCLGNGIALTSGALPVVIHPLAAVVVSVLAALLLRAGFAVRRLKDHRATWMTPLLAVRTAVAARASGLVAPACLGFSLGDLVVALTRTGASTMVQAAVGAGLGVAASLAWCVCAWVVERWCLVDIDEDGDDDLPGTPA